MGRAEDAEKRLTVFGGATAEGGCRAEQQLTGDANYRRANCARDVKHHCTVTVCTDAKERANPRGSSPWATKSIPFTPLIPHLAD